MPAVDAEVVPAEVGHLVNGEVGQLSGKPCQDPLQMHISGNISANCSYVRFTFLFSLGSNGPILPELSDTPEAARSSIFFTAG